MQVVGHYPQDQRRSGNHQDSFPGGRRRGTEKANTGHQKQGGNGKDGHIITVPKITDERFRAFHAVFEGPDGQIEKHQHSRQYDISAGHRA